MAISDTYSTSSKHSVPRPSDSEFFCGDAVKISIKCCIFFIIVSLMFVSENLADSFQEPPKSGSKSDSSLFSGPAENGGGDAPPAHRFIIGGDHNHPPFEYLDENNEPAGFNVDLTRAIAKELGIDVEIRLGSWADMQRALELHVLDAVQGMLYSSGREGTFNFTPPHSTLNYVVVSRKGEAPVVGGAEALADKRIVIQQGDLVHDFLVENGLQNQIAVVDSQLDALQALFDGKHDVAVVCRLAVMNFIKRKGEERLHYRATSIFTAELCYAALPNHNALLSQLAEGLKIVEEKGEYRRIYKKWMGIHPDSILFKRMLRYIAGFLVPLIFLFLFFLLWSWSLKKQVKKRTGELKHRNQTSASIAMASSMFVSSTEVDYTAILQVLGESLFVNKAYIFQLHGNAEKMSKNFEWCSDGTPSQMDMLQDLDTAQFSWWIGELKAEKNIILNCLEDLPSEALYEKQILQAWKTLSLIVVPLWRKGKVLWGFMGFSDTEKIRTWTQIEIKGVQLVGEMITADLERKAYKEKLEFEHQQLFAVFDGIDDIIYVSDPDTYEVLYVNQAGRAAFKKEPAGGLCYQEFYQLDQPCDFCNNEMILKNKYLPLRREFFNSQLGKDFVITDRIIKWPDGRDVRFEFAMDVTERKKNEKRLHQAHKMEAIGTLAGGIAHDFNNILSSILGYTELALLDIDENSSLNEKLQEVFKAGSRAKELVSQILTFARQTENEVKPIQVDAIVKEVLQFIRSSIPRTIEIKPDIRSDAVIAANATQVHQIMMNLCTNASQAMADMDGILKVSTQNVIVNNTETIDGLELKEGPYVEIVVSDTGSGIAPEIIETIFEPYFTTKPPGDGTGMGLAVVHGIIENYGGKIKVDSELGKGAAFKVYLPRIQTKRLDRPRRTETIPSGTDHILFVDDEESMARVGRDVCEFLGYSVTIRTDSLKALELFRANPHRFDIVITDMTMPNMTGDKLAMELMKIRTDIPIVLCTGYRYSNKIPEDLVGLSGIKTVIHKPLSILELAQTIRKVIDAPSPIKVEGASTESR